ncbi:hypothetical protein OOK31_10950 [Streptomyces sp. NBC_00249]|uniref:hypothetical protein n=1 Tax=Streptomyces sp. NBC_00249 TaxID=2975690 RepID=UPI0022588F74|nr:hypothetical protein [Streptomyces sp. NBC_00249]MCX5194407.1 hypothetical protein [Streptomyces sp. NBC_00249]
MEEAAEVLEAGFEPEEWGPPVEETVEGPGGRVGRVAEPPHGGGGGGLVAELTQLSELAQQGLLTPEEFSVAKGRLLGGG